MLRPLTLLASFIAFWLALPLLAQTLTDAEAMAAIELGKATNVQDLGASAKPSVAGGILRSTIGSAFNPLAGGSDARDELAVAIYTPKAWIAYNAAAAKKDKIPFGIGDVSEDMRRQVARIFVKSHVNGVVLRNDEVGVRGEAMTPCTSLMYIADKRPTSSCVSFEVPLEKMRMLAKDEFVVAISFVAESNLTFRPTDASFDLRIRRDKLSRLLF